MNKKKKIVITNILLIFILIISFVIYVAYESEKFFFKYNKPGDVWICDEYGITITYCEGEKLGGFWLTQTVQNEIVKGKIQGIDKEFVLSFGPGHAKNFSFYDEISGDGVLYGYYKIKDSDTFVAYLDETSMIDFDDYWENFESEYIQRIRKALVNNEKLTFRKVEN